MRYHKIQVGCCSLQVGTGQIEYLCLLCYLAQFGVRNVGRSAEEDISRMVPKFSGREDGLGSDNRNHHTLILNIATLIPTVENSISNVLIEAWVATNLGQLHCQPCIHLMFPSPCMRLIRGMLRRRMDCKTFHSA